MRNAVRSSLLRRLKSRQGLYLVVAFMCALPIAFNNCSAKMSFQASEDSLRSFLNDSGAIVINNGAEFTNNKSVTLSISHASATQMYVTNDPTCQTGGAWEPLKTIKAWTLADANRSSAVYVKFANDGQTTAASASGLSSNCMNDSIVHDDLPPVVAVTKSPGAFTNQSNIEIAYTLTDSGSGVEKAICKDKSGADIACGATLNIANAPEGALAYQISAIDRAGNQSAPQPVAFTVDRTVPTVAFNLLPSKVANTTHATIQYSGTDALSGIDHYECRTSGGAAISGTFANCPSPLERDYAAGPQHIEVRSVDRAGNMSAVIGYDWTVDLAAPTVTITSYPKPYSNTRASDFTFEGTDDSGPLVRFECKVDTGAFATCTSPKNYDLGEGPHTFTVGGFDIAGNRSADATYSWSIDLTAPTIAITSKPPVYSNSATADFALSATDGGSGVDRLECQLDGGGYKACTATPSFPTLADGPHKLDARSIDRAGNMSTPVSYSWNVDTVKPKVMITKGPAPYVGVRVATIEFTATDAGAGTLTTECRIDSGAYASCASPKLYSDLFEGGHTVWVRAVDQAGNMSDEANWAWAIDLTPPAINVGKAPAAKIYIDAMPEVAFTVTDLGSGLDTVMCGMTGALMTCSDIYSAKLPKMPVGTYSYQIVAKDKVGNESTRTLTWVVTDQKRSVTQDVVVTSSNRIDVLVVIDNSGSMATEQANMAMRFNTFLDQFTGLDWQVGIVTTDVSSDANLKDGRLVEFEDGTGKLTGKYVISSADMTLAQAKTWFADTIQRPETGSGNEQGVAATLRALQRSQQTGNTISMRNAALFRADAALAVLVVTDADETNPSGTQTQNKPQTVIDYVKTLWPSKPLSFHSIIVPIGDSACLAKDGNEGYGYAYDSFSLLTGGIRGTVCAPDYGSQLTDIGKSARDSITSVNLSCDPIDTSGDGIPDISVMTANGSAAPAFSLSGLRLQFAAPLPNGTSRISYSCWL